MTGRRVSALTSAFAVLAGMVLLVLTVREYCLGASAPRLGDGAAILLTAS
ncbi:hypothetical protein ACF05T_33320 [Streptomyces lateritius]|uniref:Uncharacterized protein n=1 Tax=Streptomyces lateritius TaxID=67313 RepID=A0ABW6YLZ7_9ACTN